MRSSGAVYVTIVVALLAGYFTYQSWFNPRREIKRRLGELAAALSTPSDSAEVERVARLARLRTYFAPDVHVALGESRPPLTSRDALLGAIGSWNPPPGGVNVSFVDVQIALESASTARAYMTVETRTSETGRPTLDSQEAVVHVAERDGEWVVTTAAPAPLPPSQR
jgi:hypothetical protein